MLHNFLELFWKAFVHPMPRNSVRFAYFEVPYFWDFLMSPPIAKLKFLKMAFKRVCSHLVTVDSNFEWFWCKWYFVLSKALKAYMSDLWKIISFEFLKFLWTFGADQFWCVIRVFTKHCDFLKREFALIFRSFQTFKKSAFFRSQKSLVLFTFCLPVYLWGSPFL